MVGVRGGDVMRLQKFIAHSGYSSRRAAEDFIQRGQVTVNGQVVTQLGTKIDPEKDSVSVNGVLLKHKEKKTYLMVHKPKGYITSKDDPQGRKTVMDLIDVQERVYPVGRLDYNSRGLLIMTNDGELANRLMHPRYQVPKTYFVHVNQKLSPDMIRKLKQGLHLEEGYAKMKEVQAVEENREHILKVLLTEGKKRQIRRMLQVVGVKVLDLQRVQIGPIGLAGLPEKQYRKLSTDEVTALKKLVGIL